MYRLSFLGFLIISMLTFSTTLRAEDINPLRAKFKEIRNTQFGTYGIFTITNIGQRDIDDINLSLFLKGPNGDTLSSMGVTDSTVGLVWLKVNQSKEEGIPLDRYKEAKLLLEKNPDKANLKIKIKNITYMNHNI
jgi:hypothetical protein